MSKKGQPSSLFHRPSFPLELRDKLYALTKHTLLAAAYPPLAKLAEPLVVSALRNIRHGTLKICTPEQTYAFSSPSDPPLAGEPQADLLVLSPNFWLRLLTMGDLGFSEAYMFGEVACDNLTQVFQIFLLNRHYISDMNSVISPLFSLISRLAQSRFINTISNSRSNISAHYDISNSMFEAFLSEDMTYSCAIFESLDSDVQKITNSNGHQPPINPNSTSGSPPPPYFHSSLPKDDLHSAQLRKLKHIFSKADIRAHHKVLEIGSGWGSFAILAVQLTGCTVDTITLSDQQQAFAQRRISALGLEHKIHVHLMDYRNMPSEWEGKFDRIVSIEMIEAVGKEFLDTYFEVLDWALKPVGGVAVIQSITIPEARYRKYVKEVDFIRKWIFPGGILPSVTSILEATLKGSQGRLICESMVNIGPHYSRTLREWKNNFEKVFDSAIAPALLNENPTIATCNHPEYELQVFKRKWLYYFSYCEIGFTKRLLGDHIIVFVREGAEAYGHIPYC